MRTTSTGRDESSAAFLLQLCAGYLVLYTITGMSVKYYQDGPPNMAGMTFLAYSLIGGTLVNLALIFAGGWWRMRSNGTVQWLGFRVPGELRYIIPSGICTAVVVPTTTLMYSLPISVMVAMTLMRGSIIVISRGVDWLQARQGINARPVLWEENLAVVLALCAVGIHLFGKSADFAFVRSVPAMTILTSYLVAYAVRIYLMNYFKNTRRAGVEQDNKGFFALEQLSSTAVVVLAVAGLLIAPLVLDTVPAPVADFGHAFTAPPDGWLGAVVLGGGAFGGVAVFSVFIFMFKGRSATFAGLVNRLTSLVAGIAATLGSALVFGGSWPSSRDWVALGFILAAVAALTRAERRRAADSPARNTA